MPRLTTITAVSLCLLAAAPVGGRAARPHTVAIEATSFQPATLTVKVGEGVVWANKDPFPHTATSQAAGFDSHAIPPGKSWRFTPKTKGEFAYICTLHPTMKATLRVE